MRFEQIILVSLIFFLLLISLISAQLYPLTSFENCSGTDFYVDVSGLGSLFEGAYSLHDCTLFSIDNKTHNWKCTCNDSLNLTLETLINFDQSYSISVVSVLAGTDYDLLDEHKKSELPVTTFIVPETESKNKITGAVIGGKTIAYGFLVVLVFLIVLGLFFANYIGGLPWKDKSERAANLHKKGQNAFESSKLNKAKRYYRRASKLRHK